MIFWDEAPSELHVMFAERLGIEVTSLMSKRDLALLVIEKRLEDSDDHPPTMREVHFAINLGIKFDFCTVLVWELVPILQAEIEYKSREALSRNPEIRAGTHLTYKGVERVIDREVNDSWRMRLAPTESLRAQWVHVVTIDDILTGKSTGDYDYD